VHDALRGNQHFLSHVDDDEARTLNDVYRITWPCAWCPCMRYIWGFSKTFICENESARSAAETYQPEWGSEKINAGPVSGTARRR